MFFETLKMMFDHDHSAARGKMSCAQIICIQASIDKENVPTGVELLEML
ncbi:hypothetical protein [Paenibacillus sp. SI8]